MTASTLPPVVQDAASAALAGTIVAPVVFGKPWFWPLLDIVLRHAKRAADAAQELACATARSSAAGTNGSADAAAAVPPADAAQELACATAGNSAAGTNGSADAAAAVPPADAAQELACTTARSSAAGTNGSAVAAAAVPDADAAQEAAVPGAGTAGHIWRLTSRLLWLSLFFAADSRCCATGFATGCRCFAQQIRAVVQQVLQQAQQESKPGAQTKGTCCYRLLNF